MIPDSLLNLNGELLCAVDVETTGLIPGYHEIIQIAVVPLNSEIEQYPGLKPFYINIAPEHPGRMSGAEGVHGISLDDLMSYGVSLETSLEMFDQWYKSLDLPFMKRLVPLAHNWAFERSFLLHWMGLEAFSDLWSGHPRDTLVIASFVNDLAAWHGKDCPFNRLNLSSVCKIMGVDLVDAHDALGDCLATAAVYRTMLRRFG